MPEKNYVSFRCYFPGESVCNHFQEVSLSDIPKWIECYRFTHPDCLAISVKIWFHDSVPN